MNLRRRKDDILTDALGGFALDMMQRESDNAPGRVVWFTGAAPGVGCSTVVRALANLATRRAFRGVFLLDLDCRLNGQHASLSLVRPGDEVVSAAPVRMRGEASLQAEGAQGPLTRPISFAQTGSERLFVSQFERFGLGPDAEVSFSASDAYWKELRTRADLVLIDAPSLQASSVGLPLCSVADACVLVVASDMDLATDAPWAQEEIRAAGGSLAGVIFNRAAQSVVASNRVA